MTKLTLDSLLVVLFALTTVLFALAPVSLASGQAPSVLLLVDDPGGLAPDVAPAMHGLLIGRGFTVRDAGAVLAARVHLFGTADGTLDDAQATQLAATLGDRLLLVAVRPLEPDQLALQVRAMGTSAPPVFVLSPRAEATARLLGELPVLLAAFAAPTASPPFAPAPTFGAPPPAQPVGTATFVAGEAPAEAPAEAPPGQVAVEEPGSDAGFFGHIAVQGELVFFPSVGRVDGSVTFRGMAAYAFNDKGWGIGAVVIGGTPTFDLGADGFIAAGAGVTLDHGFIAVGASSFLDGSVYIGFGGVTTFGNWVGVSLDLSMYIQPDNDFLSVMVGLGTAFGRPNAN